MMLGLPIWVAYATAVPCLILLAAVCLWGSFKLFAGRRD